MARHLNRIAPQFLVDGLARSVSYYREQLGFTLDFQFEDFYAGVSRDGCAIHLKQAAKIAADRQHRKEENHLDAYIDVSAAADLHEELKARGALITKGLERQPWACLDFYVEDPDGYILCFSEALASEA